jgi:hypothetical protein
VGFLAAQAVSNSAMNSDPKILALARGGAPFL